MKLCIFLLALPLAAASFHLAGGSEGDFAGISGGAPFTIAAGPLAGQTLRSGQAFSYRIPALDDVPYVLTLQFAEPCGPGAGCGSQVTGSGQRVFSVSVNDQLLLPRLDVYAAAGVQKITSRTSVVFAADSAIVIGFAGIVRTAVVSSVTLIPLFEIYGTSAAFQSIQATCSRCHGNGVIEENAKIGIIQDPPTDSPPGRVDGVGGLDLRTLAGMLAGGNRGPALARGDPAASLIYRFASRRQYPEFAPDSDEAFARMVDPSEDLAMPPFFPPTAEFREQLRAWIASGAPLFERRH